MTRIEVTLRANHFPELANLSLRPAYARMGSYLMREMARMFDSSGKSRGTPWPPLASSTLAMKRRAGRSPLPLLSSGLLRASLRPLEVSEEQLVFGTDVQYARYHDSDAPRTRLPQRKILRITDGDRAAFVGEIKRLVTETAQGGAP